MSLSVVRKSESKIIRRASSNPKNGVLGGPRLDSLLEFSQQMLNAKTLGQILADIVRFSVEILKVSFSQLYTLEPEGYFAFRIGYPTPDKNQPLDPELLKEIRARGYFQKTVISELPTIISIGKKEAGGNLQNDKENEIRTLVLLPMRVEEKPVGVLLLGENDKPIIESMKGESMAVALLIADQAAGAIHRARLSAEINEQQMQTVLALAKTVETRDVYIGGHCERIAALAEQVAIRLNCTDDDKRIIRWAALLHDIGKIGIPDEILQKPECLTKQEWGLIQRHSELGAEIVVKVSNLTQVAEIIKTHHEKFDGTGYPKHLKGDEIPIGGRILAIVDAYSAMTDGRVYQSAKSHNDAAKEILKFAGTFYDPKIVHTFLDLFK